MHGMRRWPPWATVYPARLRSVTALTQGSCAWGIYHEGICHIVGPGGGHPRQATPGLRCNGDVVTKRGGKKALPHYALMQCLWLERHCRSRVSDSALLRQCLKQFDAVPHFFAAFPQNCYHCGSASQVQCLTAHRCSASPNVCCEALHLFCCGSASPNVCCEALHLCAVRHCICVL